MFLQSTFDVRYGALERFEGAMARVVPAMAGEGWRLVGAFRHATGDVSRATHVWELPDLESLTAAPARAIAADASLLADVAVLSEVIAREELVLLEPLAYGVGEGR
ncbi:MAG TPA: NIPSNAP family protein [Baekduia sp.]